MNVVEEMVVAHQAERGACIYSESARDVTAQVAFAIWTQAPSSCMLARCDLECLRLHATHEAKSDLKPARVAGSS